MHEVLLQWVIKHKLGNIDMRTFLDDITATKIVSKGFLKRSNGILKVAIGAIDGWLGLGEKRYV